MTPLFQALAPAGPEARLSVLILHRVVAETDPLFPLEVDARRFEEICHWLRAWFHVMPLDAAVRGLGEGNLPSRALAISFDDGYADNHDVALPILRRHGLSATFFVATGFLDGGRMWNDTLVEVLRRARSPRLDFRGIDSVVDTRLSVPLELGDMASRRAAVQQLLPLVKYLDQPARTVFVAEAARRADVELPDDLMMTSAQVANLSRSGMVVGAHTVSHPILSLLDEASALREMQDSRRQLESITGEKVSLFAYPNGKPGEDYGEREVRLAREVGFAAAFSTAPGVATAHSDLFQLPRYTPWRMRRWPFALQMARNLLNVKSFAV